MKTHVVRVDAARPDLSIITHAASVLANGGLVGFPTETVYGLGALALSADAVRRIFLAKGRPTENPVIVHVETVEQARMLVQNWSNEAQLLADAFWPGPLTLVLARSKKVPDVVTAGGPTVALRIPRHPVALSLLHATNAPVAAPSANRSEHVSPTRAEHVLCDLDGKIDMILDAGPTMGGIESTVLKLDPVPTILRPGLITPSEIGAVLGKMPKLAESLSPMDQLPSPGMMRRHYAPKIPCECSTHAPLRIRELVEEGSRVGWLCLTGEDCTDQGIARVEMPKNATEYAGRLYAELRWLERMGVDRIVISRPPHTEEWWAIHDRLTRACHVGR